MDNPVWIPIKDSISRMSKLAATELKFGMLSPRLMLNLFKKTYLRKF